MIILACSALANETLEIPSVYSINDITHSSTIGDTFGDRPSRNKDLANSFMEEMRFLRGKCSVKTILLVLTKARIVNDRLSALGVYLKSKAFWRALVRIRRVSAPGRSFKKMKLLKKVSDKQIFHKNHKILSKSDQIGTQLKLGAYMEFFLEQCALIWQGA